MEAVDDSHDHAPDAFDDRLIDVEATAYAGNPGIEVIVEVPMSSATLTSLTERATREGRDVADVVADALRTAAA